MLEVDIGSRTILPDFVKNLEFSFEVLNKEIFLSQANPKTLFLSTVKPELNTISY